MAKLYIIKIIQSFIKIIAFNFNTTTEKYIACYTFLTVCLTTKKNILTITDQATILLQSDNAP